MRVQLFFFAALRDIAQRSEETIELPKDVVTIDDLRSFLETRIPAFAGRLTAVRFARNEMFSAREDTIAPGDRIALIPPVAGG